MDNFQWTQELKGLHGKGGDTYVGEGWRKIVEDADKWMFYITDGLYEIDQIKEKFGTLRFYWGLPYPNGFDDETYNMIFNICLAIVRYAEILSIYTCETCGTTQEKDKVETSSKTSTGEGYWIKTLCETCRGNRK